MFTVQKVIYFFILQKYYKFASKYIKIRNLWLTKFPVTQLLQRLISQKVDHEFSQTVGLQKNLPTKIVAFNVYWYRFITNIAILKKIINFCTENIYPNYINGIFYSKTGYYSPIGPNLFTLFSEAYMYWKGIDSHIRCTFQMLFSAMTNWGRSVTSKWPEKRMKRHLVAKMLLYLPIENQTITKPEMKHAYTRTHIVRINMWFPFYSSGNQHARLITTQTGCWSLFEERGN